MSDLKPTVRPAREEDAALIADLGARTFLQTFGAENDPQDIHAYVTRHFSRRQIESELRSPASSFFLVSLGDKTVGYAKLREGEVPTCVTGSSPVELERIYVERSHFGMGIGGVLMQACISAAREKGFSTVWLGVWEQNVRALGFYRHWGFEIVGSQEFVLGADVQNDWVMVLQL